VLRLAGMAENMKKKSDDAEYGKIVGMDREDTYILQRSGPRWKGDNPIVLGEISMVHNTLGVDRQLDRPEKGTYA